MMENHCFIVVILTILLLFTNEFVKCEKSKESNQFLAHIFNKYGSQGIITFEGLEHLMHNLGLGGLEFNPTHTVEEHHPDGFKNIDHIFIGKEIDPNIIDPLRHNNNNKKLLKSTLEPSSSSSLPSQSQQFVTNNNNNNNITTNINQTKYENSDKKNTTTNSSSSENNYYSSALPDDMWNNDLWEDTMFKQMHDPKHRHPRHYHHGMLDHCLSPVDFLQFVLTKQRNHRRHRRHNIKHHDPLTGILINEHQINNENILVKDNGQQNVANDQSSSSPADTDEFLSTIRINPSIFLLDICPALLVQLDQRACSDVKQIKLGVKEKNYLQAWIYASVSILIISMCGLAGVIIIPLTKSIAYQDILGFLVALSVGTLCGDALMHLLPHALSPHSHDNGNDDVNDDLYDKDYAKIEPILFCACAFMAMLIMFTLETILPRLSNDNHGHGHGHSHGHSHKKKKFTRQLPKSNDLETINKSDQHEMINMLKTNDKHNENDDDKILKKKNKKKLSPVAFMVILGDGLHNITDGLAIGAAFALDPVTGMATAFAVLCHELPHELGDFALLLQTGVSIRKAILFNLFSSVLSVIGMIIGLIVAGVETSFVRWIYAGTSGTFLYIALADLIPEMRRPILTDNLIDKSVDLTVSGSGSGAGGSCSGINGTQSVNNNMITDDDDVGDGAENQLSLKTAVIQVMGILAGGIIMLAIALYEDKLRGLFE